MDKRIIKTKERICDALLQLMKEKKSSKITVSEIAKISNIERKTFYLHYNCIEDVYADIETSITEQLENEINKYIENPNYQIKNIYYNLNTVINNNMTFFKSVSVNDSYSYLLHSFEKALSKIIIRIAKEICHVDSNNLQYYTDFYAAGIVKLYLEWLRGETNLTLVELTIILTRASFMSVEELINSKQ